MPKKKQKKPEGFKTKLRRPLASEPSQEDLPARVQLDAGGDAYINGMIRTSLEEELNSLEDVIVADDHPRYRVFVTGMDEPEPIVAVAITGALGMESGGPYGTILKTMLTGRLKQEGMDAVEKIVSEHDHISVSVHRESRNVAESPVERHGREARTGGHRRLYDGSRFMVDTHSAVPFRRARSTLPSMPSSASRGVFLIPCPRQSRGLPVGGGGANDMFQ